jgi:hypothetical protein
MNNTSELEAVNSILAAIGEAPVNALDGDKPVDVSNALNTLREVSREVQSRGWSFNREVDYPLVRDGNSKIPVPANASKIVFPAGQYTDIDPVPRGGFVYDRKNRSFVFTKDVKACVLIFTLDFTDLPETARRFITMKASRLFVDRFLGGQAQHVYTQADEQRSWSELLREECEAENTNTMRTDIVREIFSGRTLL